MPFTTRQSKGKTEKRFLNESHFNRFKWLTYSEAKEGLFCKVILIIYFMYISIVIDTMNLKVCVLAGRNEAGRHSVSELRSLVSEPLKHYSHLLGW